MGYLDAQNISPSKAAGSPLFSGSLFRFCVALCTKNASGVDFPLLSWARWRGQKLLPSTACTLSSVPNSLLSLFGCLF